MNHRLADMKRRQNTSIKFWYTVRITVGFAILAFAIWLTYWLLFQYRVRNVVGVIAIIIFLVCPALLSLLMVPKEIAGVITVLKSDDPGADEKAMERIRDDAPFGGRYNENDKLALVAHMDSMAAESERVYRNFIRLYCDETNQRVAVCGRGLFKARFQYTIFMIQAFNIRWPGEIDEMIKLANVASGVALMPLAERDSDPHFDRNEAKEVWLDIYKRTLKGIVDEFENGMSLPDRQTQGFRDLAELYHDALRDSIGSTAYTTEVRTRFDHLVKMGIMSSLRRTTEVADSL